MPSSTHMFGLNFVVRSSTFNIVQHTTKRILHAAAGQGAPNAGLCARHHLKLEGPTLYRILQTIAGNHFPKQVKHNDL